MTTAGGLTVAAMAAVALATAAALPAGRVFGLVLVGIAACLAATIYYLAEHPSYDPLRSNGLVASLAPVTAVVLAVALTGGGWLALRPPRWLVPDRHGRRWGIAMALVLVAGFVLASRQELRRAELDIG